MLKLVFVNLIANALKFTRPRNRQRLKWHRKSEDEITVYVRDNGVRFDMRYVDKFFNVFSVSTGKRNSRAQASALAKRPPSSKTWRQNLGRGN
jgi:light-regulated signal transduction histidine kinase (bacteriophytochrome)